MAAVLLAPTGALYGSHVFSLHDGNNRTSQDVKFYRLQYLTTNFSGRQRATPMHSMVMTILEQRTIGSTTGLDDYDDNSHHHLLVLHRRHNDCVSALS